MSTTIPVMATIQSITPLTHDTKLFTITASEALPRFQPGQFVQLSVPGVGEMPISYCGRASDANMIELCVRSVGRVSSALMRLPVAAQLGVRAPLGHGFPVHQYAGKNLLLIAGGVGMAPIRSLLHTILQERELYGTITVLHGARSPGQLLFEGETRLLAAKEQFLYLTAVDCPEGKAPECHSGLLHELTECCSIDSSRTVASVCAPPAAYPQLIEKLREHGMDDYAIHLSLERQMKCGIGQCGHCAVGSLLCCVDGPVFSLSEILTQNAITP